MRGAVVRTKVVNPETHNRVGDDPSFAAFLRDLATTPTIARDRLRDYELLSTGGVVIDDTIEIVRELDRGGMSRIFLGRDRSLGRDVAVKVVNAAGLAGDPHGSIEFLAHEARATAQLKHPNIVTIHRYGSWNGLPYIVFELVEGDSLAELLAKGPLPVDQALSITRQLLSGLTHSHAAGVLHRDLKPQNIFVRDGGVVTILDFGVSSVHWGETTPVAIEDAAPIPGTTALRAGTPAYMAPEQWSGARQDERTDLWAVGLILAEMVTGKSPPTLGTAAAAVATERSWPEPALFEREVDRRERRRLGEIERLVRKATALRAEDRFAHAEEMLAAVDGVSAAGRRSNRWLVWPVAGLLLVAGGGGWHIATRASGATPPVILAPACDWSGTWATLATSTTGSYPFDIEVAADGGQASGSYQFSEMTGVIEDGGVVAIASGAAGPARSEAEWNQALVTVYRGTWSRVDGPPSGGPCEHGRFRLDAHRDAAEGCVFTGYWSYCDDPPDAKSGWWWRGRKLTE